MRQRPDACALSAVFKKDLAYMLTRRSGLLASVTSRHTARLPLRHAAFRYNYKHHKEGSVFDGEMYTMI